MALLQYLTICGLLVITGVSSDPVPSPTPGGLTFLGVGYDILIGNPEGGDVNTGGVDPGLLTTRKIFKLTYDDNRLSNDLNYRVPDEVVFAPRDSCVGITSQEVFHGTQSYQEKVGVDISTSAGVQNIFASFEFSLSSRYQNVRTGTETSRKVYYEERTVCNKGQARYRTELARQDQYPLGDGFVADACELTSTYNQNDYMNFIQKWGTHVVTDVDVGTKVTSRSEEEQQNFVHYAMNQVQNSVSTQVGVGNYEFGLRVDMDVFKQSLTSGMSFGRNTYTYRSGGNDMHEPISLVLKGIHETFDMDYWQLFNEYVSQGRCSSSWIQTLTTIKANVETALRNYPSWRNANPSDDPIVAIPVTWPKGTYGLPMPTAGCPNSFVTGWRYHDTEDDDSANSWSNPCHLQGPYGAQNAQQNFCMKTIERADIYDWTFPEGQYCIFKKGNSCPTGLAEGWIYWDDEDSSNANRLGGELPNGDYGRNTKIYYCCSTSGFASNPIYLPVDDNFFLFKYNHQCQQIHGMNYISESFHWDTEDDNPSNSHGGAHPYPGVNGRNIDIQYCYYYR